MLHFSGIKQKVDDSLIKFADRHKDALEKQIAHKHERDWYVNLFSAMQVNNVKLF